MSAAPAAPTGAPTAADLQHIAQQLQQQVQQQMQQLQQQQQQAQQAQFVALSQQMQQPAVLAAQLLALSSQGQLRRFNGRTTGGAAAAGLAARDWLTQAEQRFRAREAALSVTAAQADAARLSEALQALDGDALRWSLAQPVSFASWDAFRTAFLQRFCSVATVQVREEQLSSFVDSAARLRERLNADGMHRLITQFLQMCSEIPDERMTGATKRRMLARTLPPRYAELVFEEDSKDAPLPLHELAQAILAKATRKQFAGTAAGGSGAGGSSGDAMQLDALTLAAVGISREEAAAYTDDAEDWAPHDTDYAPRFAPAAAPTSSAAGSAGADMEARLLAVIESRLAQGSKRGRESKAPRSSSKKKEVPEQLAAERRAAGLCVRCGVVAYAPGPSGHSSLNCKAPADKSTSAAEGARRAGLQGF
jgi:hypothetical protein